MYKIFKFLTMSVLIFSLVPYSNSMEENTITQNTINANNNINQNDINIGTQINQQNNTFFIYDPYSTNSPIPTMIDMLTRMKIKALDLQNNNVKQCFNYLQEHDIKNYLLLNHLLEHIYSRARNISTVGNNNENDINYLSHIICDNALLSYNIDHLDYFEHEDYYYEFFRDLEEAEEMVPEYQYSDILKFFNALEYKFNPEKYKENKYVLHTNSSSINLIQFCYYISNMLVCISHDIIYAINKEINKKNITREEVSNNIYKIITQSFDYIMEALTNLKSGMFFIEFLPNIDKKIYDKFQNHFRKTKREITFFENDFNKYINHMNSNITKTELDKIKELVNKIREYKNSNEFKKTLNQEIQKDKNLSVKDQYNNIIKYCEEHNKRPFSHKIDYSSLIQNGKINEELVKEISEKNIERAMKLIQDDLIIANRIYKSYYNNIPYYIAERQLYETIYEKPLNTILYDSILYISGGVTDFYYCDIIDTRYTKDNYEELINNGYLCYNMYYRKYVDIILKKLPKMIEEVFTK